jgi:hypothetical protein
MNRWYTLGISVLLLITSSNLFGQATAASALEGTVVDRTQAAIPNADVTITNQATGAARNMKTTATGGYRFDLLPAGVYNVKVNAAGFSITEAKNVQLLVSSTTTQDITLSPGGTSETVEVTGAAPLVDQQKTDVGLNITPSQIQDLPLNGRDFANLAYLAPGAKPSNSYDPTKNRMAVFGVNGSNGRNVNVTVNGVDDKDNTVGGPVMQLPLEAVQEFNISTQRFSAANGRSEGAAVNVITKAGTNDYHGSLYFFDTETALNANDFFSKQSKQPTPEFSRQQFGGSAGGPIRKEQDFLFFAYERLREHTSIPVTGKAFSELSLVTSLGAQPAQTIPTPYFDTRYTGRYDHRFNTNHSFFLTYSSQGNNSLNDQSLNTYDLSEGNFTTNQLQLANATLNSVLTPNFVNSFTAGFQYWNNVIDSKTRSPLFTFPGSIQFGTNTNVPQQSYQRKYQFRDDMSYQRGNHGLKWGVDYLWEPRLGGYFEFNSTLEFDFNDFPSVITGNTNGKYPQGFKTPGAVTGMSISIGDPKEDLPGGAKMLGLYFEDDWKATRKLNLNLGLRYDRDFNLMGTNAQAGSRTYQLLKAINSPFAGIPKDYNKAFSPRVGFAYDLTGNGKNILRGGYGLYVAQTFLNIPLFMIQQANPTLFATVFSISAKGPGTSCNVATCAVPGTSIPLSSYRLGVDPMPTIPPPITNLTGGAVGRLMEPHYRNPYSQQWNMGFAHEINPATVVELDYIHELGLHEEKRQILNYTDPATGIRVLSSQLAAAGQPQIARISMETSSGRSRYDGLNLSLRRRMTKMFSVNAIYTLSEGWAYNGNAASYSNTVTDPTNPLGKQDFGPVPNDERHRLVVSGTVDLPWGFQIAPIMQVASARPYNTSSGISNVLGFGSGVATAHAIVFKNNPGDLAGAEIANGFDATKLLACINAGQCEQAHFNALRGQAFFQLDTRVTKGIKLGERANLKLMFQGFDITNRANFGNNFDGNVANIQPSKGSTFGTPIGYITPAGTIVPKSFRAEFGAQFNF